MAEHDEIFPNEPKLLLARASVARLLDMSCAGVRDLDERGLLPAPLKIGRVRRWRRLDIEGWVDAGCLPRGKETMA